MALDRFQNFQNSAVQPGPDGPAPPHLDVQEHGPLPVDRPSYVRRFLRRTWGVAAVGAVAAGALVGMSHEGAAVLGPMIGDNPVVNGAYQFVERTVLGKQAGLDQQAQELKALDDEAHALGIYTVRPTITVSYYHDGAADAVTSVDGTCTIEVSMDEKGRMTRIGVKDGLMDSDDPAAIRRHRNYIVGHEDAHCTFHSELAPFRGSGLAPATEHLLNDWVFGPGASDHNNAVQDMFNETQADVVGELVMLHEDRFSAGAWAEVENDWYDRRAKQRYEEAHQYSLASDPHATAPALRDMLDHKAEIEALSPGHYRDYAYKVASRSVMAQLDAARERAVPAQALNDRLTPPNDPLRRGQVILGELGLGLVTRMIQPVHLRIAIVEQALQIREEQLGLRVAVPGVDHVAPRQIAQQWLAQDNPFRANAHGVVPVTFQHTNDGTVSRTWAGNDKNQAGLHALYDPATSAPPVRTPAAYNALLETMGWPAAQADLARALHADPASLEQQARTAPYHPLDMGDVKPSASSVASSPSALAPVAATIPSTASITARVPSRHQLARKLDQASTGLSSLPSSPPAMIRASRPPGR